ncbi:hypothetical protein RN001_005606 [Aquatica leii]|uniref:SWIM-type domain-containing protein n=1 Tax=Aquatica leii TaxID=1421715 RepID=A0AAN7SHX5_9COLE|nr:hypothetical protein RN001_005606 [Aquatica leii]
MDNGKVNIIDLKRELKLLGAKTTGSKEVLEKRLNTWKSNNLKETLFPVNVVTVSEPEDYPSDNYFKPLNLSGDIKLLNFEAIQCWFLLRKAKKGMQRGRILAMKLFIKYTKIYQIGNFSYLKGKCCAEQKKTMEYNVQIKITNINKNKYQINQCNCTCPAGTGWSAACKHVGAFCFSLEHFSITGKPQEYVSCTAQAVQWNKPKGRGIGSESSKFSSPRKTIIKKKSKQEISDFDKGILKRVIHNFHMTDGTVPSLKTILLKFKDAVEFEGGRETLRKIIHDIGFRWRKTKSNRQILMEKTDIQSLRTPSDAKLNKSIILNVTVVSRI